MDQDYSEVFIPFSDYHCGGCGESLQKAIVFIFRDDGKPICLKCADLDSPVFLPDDGATIEQTVCQDSTLGIFFIGADERKFRRKKRKAFPVTVVDLKNQAHKQQ
ncbi:MAG: hypothetical protein ABSH41_30625, partial [Syntrophobacteraceae bacterium]